MPTYLALPSCHFISIELSIEQTTLSSTLPCLPCYPLIPFKGNASSSTSSGMPSGYNSTGYGRKRGISVKEAIEHYQKTGELLTSTRYGSCKTQGCRASCTVHYKFNPATSCMEPVNTTYRGVHEGHDPSNQIQQPQLDSTTRGHIAKLYEVLCFPPSFPNSDCIFSLST